MPFIRNTALTLVLTISLSLCSHAQESNSETKQSDFEKFKSSKTRKLCVNFLDGYLCLSREQKDAMEKLLEKHWTEDNDSRSGNAFWLGYNSIRGCMDSINQNDVQSILSDGQMLQLELLPKHALNQTSQRNYLQEPVDENSDPLEITLNVAKDLEIQRLESLLGLKEDQTKLLRVAANGAMSSVLGQRKTWKEKIAAGAILNNGWVPIAVEAPAFRIRNTKIWKTTLKRILSEGQASILQDDQSAAFAESAYASAHSLALSYFRNQPLSQQEYEKFMKLLVDAIEAARAADEIVAENSLAFEAVDIFIRLDDTEIKKSVSEASWEVMSPLLNGMRARNEAQQENDERNNQ